MLLDRNTTDAAFLFRMGSLKAYLTDSDYKVKEAELVQEDDYFVLPVKASEFEKPNYGVSHKAYYVLAENEIGSDTKFKVIAYQRNNEMATPSAVVEYLCLAGQYTNNFMSAYGNFGTAPERTLIGEPQKGNRY